MNIGVLTVNNFDFHPNRRLKQAAEEQDHHIILINPYDMLSEIAGQQFNFSIKETDQSLDVVMPRQGAPMGDYGLVLLRQLMQNGIPLVNGLTGITIARNQFITLQALASAGLPVPDTVFITKKENFAKAVDRLGGYPVILKQVDGMGGDGVIRADMEADGLDFLNRHLKAHRGVIVQQFFTPENRVDTRLFVIGNKVAGAMQLTPRDAEFRANIHQNGQANVIKPSSELIEIAIKSAKACHLEIAGVDLIAARDCTPRVIEVNYSPGFRGLEAATGLNIAGQIIDYISAIYS